MQCLSSVGQHALENLQRMHAIGRNSPDRFWRDEAKGIFKEFDRSVRGLLPGAVVLPPFVYAPGIGRLLTPNVGGSGSPLGLPDWSGRMVPYVRMPVRCAGALCRSG